MNSLLILNTGGTFNKRYNPLKGELEVPTDSKAIDAILRYCYNTPYTLVSLIHKDSLDMNDEDRALLVQTILKHDATKVLIIHGTDTMDATAAYLALHVKDKTISLTGAMVPFSIDTVEATTNLALAIGDLQVRQTTGVFISMHGITLEHTAIYKNRTLGIFEPR